jgi:hypothetical protein
MMIRTLQICSPLLAAVLLCSCGSDEQIDPSVEKLGRATGPVAPGRQATAPAAPGGGHARNGPGIAHDGVVLERIHVPNYTYLRLGLEGGREAWAAIPRTEIEVGTRARVIESLVMHEFTSPTLGRTFASIVFGVLEGGAGRPGDAGTDEAPLPPGHPPI